MLPKKDAPAGLYLFCKKHDKWYKNDNVVKCTSECKLKYKAKLHIPGTKRRSRIKILQAENFDDALLLFQNFKSEMRRNSFQKIEIEQKTIRPITVTDCIRDFIDFKEGKGNFGNKQTVVCKGTLNGYKRSCQYFTYALSDNGIDASILRFSDITPKMAWMFSDYLMEKYSANKAYNNSIMDIRSFAKYIIEKYYHSLQNPFHELIKFNTKGDTRSVTKSEFMKLIDRVNYDNGWKKKKGKTKRINVYKPWLIDAFYLGLFTGGRNEEVAYMKWSDIKLNEEGEISLIELTDFKISRQKKDGGIENIQHTKTVAMNPEFEDYLRELGYERMKDTNEFILAPHVENRNSVKADFSLGFSHYFKQLNLPVMKNFKHLRKTYITNCYIQTPETRDFLIRTGHAKIDTPLKHYIDMKMVMEARRKKLYEQSRAKANG